jgi:Holliday junction resolvasome RuvABC endonuclease subunit
MTLWIRKWRGVGFGVMGEQGAESIHAEFNRIELRHRNQRHDRVERLRRVVTEHLTKSFPRNVAAHPPTKRRKIEE